MREFKMYTASVYVQCNSSEGFNSHLDIKYDIGQENNR